jgi:TniQ
LREPISLEEATWYVTFPHRVLPLQDEWLLGLLLRCDEINHWGSRTTLTHLLDPGPEKFHRCWRTENPYLVLIQPSSLNLEYLAQRLSLPTSMLLATTYHTELLRLYDEVKPHPRLLSASFTFHLCPACLLEARLLRRNLTLPHITHCPHHQMTLALAVPMRDTTPTLLSPVSAVYLPSLWARLGGVTSN